MPEFKTIGKSKQFYEFLKNEILSGEYKPGDKFPSIRKLSEKCNISTVTVNSVISNLVTEGYLYIEQGRGTFVNELKHDPRKDKKIIGVMFFDFRMENNIEASMFNSVQENLKDNYYLIPYNSYDDIQTFYKGLKGFAELEVDGLILVPPASEKYDAGIVRNLIPEDVPIVFINRAIGPIMADFIGMDFETATYMAAKHIFEQGRQRILLVQYNSPSISKNMTNGYIRAYKEAGLSVDENFILNWPSGNNEFDCMFSSKLIKILKRQQYVDGLVASDILIYKYRKCLSQANRIIPDNLSIVSINDTVYSRYMDPPLTTVPFPSIRIGEKAAKIITDRIEGKTYEYIHEYIVDNLVMRKS